MCSVSAEHACKERYIGCSPRGAMLIKPNQRINSPNSSLKRQSPPKDLLSWLQMVFTDVLPLQPIRVWFGSCSIIQWKWSSVRLFTNYIMFRFAILESPDNPGILKLGHISSTKRINTVFYSHNFFLHLKSMHVFLKRTMETFMQSSL